MGRDDLRVRRIKQYVLARLREELANAPRGAQARLAKRLGVSGAHLSNMLSSTPSRQPGEDFRRKVAAHWGVSYAELEAIAFGEEPPVSTSRVANGIRDAALPNLTTAVAEYVWMPELPADLRSIVCEQARMWYGHTKVDLARDEWQRILTGLEREALALMARRTRPPRTDEGPRAARANANAKKRRAR